MKKLLSSNDKSLIIKIAVLAIRGILNCSCQKYPVVAGSESHPAFRKFHFTEKGVSLFMRLLNIGTGRNAFKFSESPVK